MNYYNNPSYNPNNPMNFNNQQPNSNGIACPMQPQTVQPNEDLSTSVLKKIEFVGMDINFRQNV